MSAAAAAAAPLVDCKTRLFVNFDFGAVECYTFLISKLLGIAIIVASFSLKVPQIMKILKNKSVDGLSFGMFLLELFGFIFQGSYAFRNGFPLDSYMEVFVILGQNFIIIYLMYKFTTGINAQAIGVLGGAFGLLAWELTTMPLEHVATLQSSAIVIFAAAKIPQILKGFQEKSTGQLDLFMVSLQLLGSMVRIFTTMQSVDDPLYLLSYIIGSSLNAILVFQVLFYGPDKKTKKE